MRPGRIVPLLFLLTACAVPGGLAGASRSAS